MESSLGLVIFFALIGGVFSLIGGFLLIAGKKHTKKVALYATPFAAGALLAAAFFDLLPETAHSGNFEIALTLALVGILSFFLIERFLRWFHHHHQEHKDEKKVGSSLIIIGDTIHNFIDGIAIAAGFLVDVPTGIVVTIAVAAHEIPQEIGDFGILLSKGMSRGKVVVVNIFSALATVLAAAIFYSIGQNSDIDLAPLLGLVAGFFIYIAVSDIIPSIHHTKNQGVATLQTLLLVLGVVVVGTVTSVAHDYIETDDHDHGHSTSHNEEHDHEEDYDNNNDEEHDENHNEEHSSEQ